MRDAEPTDREAALQATIERLEDRIAILERAMGLDFLPPVEWALTPNEARLLGALMEREVLTKDAAMAALYRDRGADEPDAKIVDVFICKLRAKLKRFGLSIETRWGVGYQLTPATKAAIRAALTGAEAA